MNVRNGVLKHKAGNKIKKLFRIITLYQMFFLSASHSAYCQDDDFYKKCRFYLAEADKFADQCLQKARPFERTFYPNKSARGETEAFKIYFKSTDDNSRFILGCVLDGKGKVRYAGIYYSYSIINGEKINNYPISFVDFNSNVGLIIKDRQLTLLAIRRFVTEKIPEYVHYRKINCQIAELENYALVPSPDEKRYEYENLSGNVIGRYFGNLRTDNKYNVYFGKHDYPLIFANNVGSIMVDQKGTLLLQDRKSYNNPCIYQKSDNQTDYNIFYEMCRPQ